MGSRLFRIWLGLSLALACFVHGETRLLRFPDLHGDKVVFTYGGDLWTASAQGGVAARLTSHPGLEAYPKFSPDGRWIAFTGQYDGDEQVYVIPAEGGVPRELTFYPAFGPLYPWIGSDNQVLGWTPDSRSVLFWSMRDADGVLSEGSLYTVGIDGGPSRRLPVGAAGAGALAPDGRRLAYEPVHRDASNWKRYGGGRARGLYLMDLAGGQPRRVAASKRSERDPMWVGDQLCFTSDRDGTLNLYTVDPATDAVRQLTRSGTWDVRWPSTDHVGRIIYEEDGGLRILDLRNGTDRALAITVPTDGGASRPTRVQAEVEGYALAPHGERALMVARGEVFTVPIEKGPVRNLTRDSRAHARLARWSPDGRTIAFVSDRSGEEEVYLVDQDGRGGPRPLTTTLRTALRALAWAPDGRNLAVADQRGRVLVVGVARAGVTVAAQDPEGGAVDFAWAPDGGHLAITLATPGGIQALHVWSAAEGVCRQVTPGLAPVRCPAWDPRGRYLYYLSRRTYPSGLAGLEDDGSDGTGWGIFALALRKGTPHPFPPESDEVALGTAGPEAAPPPAPGPLAIDWEGLAARVARVPVEPGALSRLEAVPGQLLYLRDDVKPDLCLFDLASRRETVLAEDLQGFQASAGGRQALLRQGEDFFLLEVRAGAQERKPVSVRDLVADVVPAQEWAEIFDEVWRRYRDRFYAANMHGVDWQAVGDRYRPLLRHVSHRSDLTYLLLEMVGELNVGHAFLGGGDFIHPARPRSGLPGAEFEVDPAAGRYRIRRIFQGQNEEPRYRSPLTEVGVDAREGDYVLAIDGQDLAGADDPYRLLRNKTGPVTLTLNAVPSLQGARRVTYTPVEDEAPLRYLGFVLRSLARVKALSGGRAGYLHLPDMEDPGLAEFIKWYFPQIRSRALVVDVRANHGGCLSPVILDCLERKAATLSFRRGSPRAEPDPGPVFCGPMVCLMSETTSSDGELFAHAFRQAGLGPLVGLRTWGGAVGYLDSGPLKDGGFVWVPSVGTAGPDGHWIIEGEGVRPDLAVENDPRALLEGRDPQLDTAVAEVLRRLEAQPGGLPAKPADPVKAK